MPFASIAATATTNGSTAAQNKACNLPSGIQAGNLLLLWLRSNGTDSHTTPTGWTQLILNNTADASDDVTSLWYRYATGSEGSSVTVTCTTSQKFTALAWRITGANEGSAPEVATATGTSTTPDPPSVTASWGADDNLWIAVYGIEGTATNSAYPANYTLNQFTIATTGGTATTNSRSASAARQLNAATENPGTFTASASEDWTAVTIVIRPATYFNRTDAAAYGSETAGQLSAQASAADAGTYSGESPAGIAAQVSGQTDAAAYGGEAAAALTVQRSVADSAIYQGEQPAVVDIIEQRSGADSASYAAAESSSVNAALQASDAASYAAAESSSLAASYSVSDSSAYAAAESASLNAAVTALDAASYASADASTLSAAQSSADAAAYAGESAAGLSASASAADSATYVAGESSQVDFYDETVYLYGSDGAQYAAETAALLSASCASLDAAAYQAESGAVLWASLAAADAAAYAGDAAAAWLALLAAQDECAWEVLEQASATELPPLPVPDSLYVAQRPTAAYQTSRQVAAFGSRLTAVHEADRRSGVT